MCEKRRDMINYRLDIAEVLLERGVCPDANTGAVICSDGDIVGTGCTDVPKGCPDCCGSCENAESVCLEAEIAAVLASDRAALRGASMYIVKKSSDGEYLDAVPSGTARKIIIAAGISDVFVRVSRDEFRAVVVSNWSKEA